MLQILPTCRRAAKHISDHGMEDYFEPAIHIVHNDGVLADGNQTRLMTFVE
ncbi:MAG: hypothetical protein ACLVEE_11705 [Phocaeicola vulgatus]